MGTSGVQANQLFIGKRFYCQGQPKSDKGHYLRYAGDQ